MADQDDLARDLLGLAEDDRAAAEALLDAGAVSDAIVGFIDLPPSLFDSDLLTPYGVALRYGARSPRVVADGHDPSRCGEAAG